MHRCIHTHSCAQMQMPAQKIGADVAKRQKKKKKWIQYTVVHWNPSFSLSFISINVSTK